MIKIGHPLYESIKGGVPLKTRYIILIIVCLTLILTSCGKKGTWFPVSGDKTITIMAPIINAKDDEIGQVTFTETSEGMSIDIIAEGLKPGLHGTHIHEVGKCETPKFESAGGHFNPTGKEHGFKNPAGFHLGDLPNIEVGPEGRVSVSLRLTDITLKTGAENSILDSDGSALIIHQKADDNITDPSGNSGDRIACAAITEDMVK